MKSEHRHELQTNELDKVATQLGGFFEQYGNHLMIGVLAVSLVASGSIYWYRSSQAREAAGWRDLSSANRAEDFADVWDTHPGTVAAQWARVHEGESRLNEGIQLLFTNVESAQKELKQARDVFQAIVDQRSSAPVIRERALFGLARSLESLSEGETADAVKAYETLLREFPDSVHKKDAEARIAELGSPEGKDFYAWFAKFPRPKTPEKRPKDEGTGDSDVDEEKLLKEIESSLKSKEGAAEEAGPTLKIPADKGEEPSGPATSKESGPETSGEKPAEEAPATGEKPSDEKPTDEAQPESSSP